MEDLFNKWNYLCQKKEQIKEIMIQHQNDIVYYMIFLRLFPATPNALMNISLPHLGVKTIPFAISVFIGIAPWNFFACSAGNILSTLASTRSIMGKEEYFQVSHYI